MPLKTALAIALAAILTPLAASSAYAAHAETSTVSAHTHKTAAQKHSAKKARPASTKVSVVDRRKHDAPSYGKDTRPDSHAGMAAISLAKPLETKPSAVNAIDRRSSDKRAEGKKTEGRRREARKSESKKGSPKKDGAPEGAPIAASIATPLPPLPGPEAETKREPLEVGRKGKGRKGACLSAPIDIAHGDDEERLSLTTCEGTAVPGAVERMSILLGPGGAAGTPNPRLDARMIERLGAVTGHFGKPGTTLKIHVVSGSRPKAAGSYHATGRAIDFRIDGVTNEDVVAFCKTLTDTGCGYYPNSSFVHIDAREPGTGHVAWIDASGPGEAPRYVSQWPPPAEEEPHKANDSRQMIEDLLATLEKELPRAPKDEHPGAAKDLETPKAEIERELP